MLLEGFTPSNSLEGISLLTESINLTPCFVLSSIYDGVNLCRMNCLKGNALSNFV